MSTYLYTAFNENGNPISGEIDADSSEQAFELLAARGDIPDTVKKKSSGSSDSDTGFSKLDELLSPIKPREIILFTKQFKTLIKAGVPMIQIFGIMEAQTGNKRLRHVISCLLEDIREGDSLSKAFIKHERLFSPLYCSMIRAGESSGSLPEVLDRLIYIIQHENKVKSDIKAALRYPAIVTIMLGCAFIFLLTFIIPKFISIFEKIGLDLPIPTQICIFLYSILSNYWHIMLVVIIVTLVALLNAIRTETGRFYKDRFLMKLPLFGPLFVKASMSRFASIFSILQSSGLTVLDSMDILADTISNAAITREFVKVKEMLTEGKGISRPLKAAKYFTPMVVNMIAIGEESGNLDEMLQEVANHYDSEVEYSTKSLADAIAPILTIGLAAVVGFFALAIFLPMWDLTKMVK
ncbi:MAG: type II secretion system F family protein [Pseudomonadota bacterium]